MSEQRMHQSDPALPQAEAGAFRYASLADYLRVIRRRRLLIAAVIALVTLAALAISLSQAATYQATAQLRFEDPLANSEIFGTGSGITTSPLILAQQGAELVHKPEIARAVRKRLKSSLSLDELDSSVTTEVGVNSNLVDITAKAGTAELAAKIANAYAKEVQRVGTDQELHTLKRAEASIKDQLAAARREQLPSAFQISTLLAELTRVRNLTAVARPVQIVTPASAPSSQASPNVPRNLALGFALGLVLALMLAFVRESLDRRMHSAADIHRELGVPVLGTVSEAALGKPGLAPADASMADWDFEAFRVLRTNLAALAAGGPIKTILITSAQAEEGKSTVSASLASAAAVVGQRVLLVECDLRRPSLASRMGLALAPGLTDYLAGKAEPREILQVVRLREPMRVNGASSSSSVASLVCISAGSPVSQPAELLVSERFKDFVEKVSRAYDLVVFDSSPLLSVVDPLELVFLVDCVMVCVRAFRTTREEARAVRVALGHLPEKPTGAVVTGIRPGDPDAYAYYYSY